MVRGSPLRAVAGTRDYNVGEPPEPAVVAVAQTLGLQLRPDFVARHSDAAVRSLFAWLPSRCSLHSHRRPMLCCMICCCRWTSSPPQVSGSSAVPRCFCELMQPADVMREVTVYDTIEPQANYSAKVHSLAPFHASGHLDEIDDPLYGSTERGGPEEVAAVTAAAALLDSCCEARATCRDFSRRTLTLTARTPGPCRLYRVGGRGCGRGQRRQRGGIARATQRAARAADQQRPDGVASAADA